MNNFLLFLALVLASSEATARSAITLQPQPLSSVEINATQSDASCSYTVSIKTSCSSPRYTRDQISLSFGDAYGNQVYAPRLDDPSTRTFERCSVDTFQISGPCMHHVCYLYLYRTGYDGWKPESVQVYGYYSGSVNFYYNTFIPTNVWFGFNYCGRRAAAPEPMSWFAYLRQRLLGSM